MLKTTGAGQGYRESEAETSQPVAPREGRREVRGGTRSRAGDLYETFGASRGGVTMITPSAHESAPGNPQRRLIRGAPTAGTRPSPHWNGPEPGYGERHWGALGASWHRWHRWPRFHQRGSSRSCRLGELHDRGWGPPALPLAKALRTASLFS